MAIPPFVAATVAAACASANAHSASLGTVLMHTGAESLHLTERGRIARVLGATLVGLDGHRVRVEVDVAPALPAFSLVGLPGTALRESRERIGAALRHAGFGWPEGRVTVNLAPADLRKEGASLDLPIAVGILLASGQIARPTAERLRHSLFVGEVTLDGALRSTRGLAALMLDAEGLGVDRVVSPPDSSGDGIWSTVPRVDLHHLGELRQLRERLEHPVLTTHPSPATSTPRPASQVLAAIAGQWSAKRALLLAALGRHHMYLQGPPGCGKTLLARAMAELLPRLDADDLRTQIRIRSCAGLSSSRDPFATPFRAPHHSVTTAGLVGGGRPPRPGEITLAHGGVLFLDELPEFGAARLDRLREVLESGVIRHARLGQSLEFPARFQLVGAGNPCPCGWHGSSWDRCRCTAPELRRHHGRLSGPLRDRIDLWVDVDRESAKELWSEAGCEIDDAAFARACAARSDSQGAEFALDPEARRLLEGRADRRGMTPRSVRSTVRVATSIARLEGAEVLRVCHVAEALSYRPSD